MKMLPRNIARNPGRDDRHRMYRTLDRATAHVHKAIDKCRAGARAATAERMGTVEFRLARAVYLYTEFTPCFTPAIRGKYRDAISSVLDAYWSACHR